MAIRKKTKIKKAGSYKKYFMAVGLVMAVSGFITIISSQSIRAQISGLYNRQNDQVAGVTALMSAVVSHDIEGVKFFSKGGKALINQKNLGGATALHLACRNKDFEIAKILIDSGADVNALDNEKWSPLMRAALEGDDVTINLLLDNGADATYLNSIGESALYQAVVANCNACLAALVNKFDFTKNPHSEIVKKQISDAFIIAGSRDNGEMQVVLSNLLDTVDKSANLGVAQDSSKVKVFNFAVDNKKSKKFNVKKSEKALKPKGFALKKPVEEKIEVKAVEKPEIKADDKIKAIVPMPKAEPKTVNSKSAEIVIPQNAIEQKPAIVYDKEQATPKFKLLKAQEKPETVKKMPVKDPVKAESDYTPLSLSEEEAAVSPSEKNSKGRVFKFMQEASKSKGNTTNVAE